MMHHNLIKLLQYQIFMKIEILFILDREESRDSWLDFLRSIDREFQNGPLFFDIPRHQMSDFTIF